MDLDSIDLQDNELDEVVSQPLPMCGEPLFEVFQGGRLLVLPWFHWRKLRV